MSSRRRPKRRSGAKVPPKVSFAARSHVPQMVSLAVELLQKGELARSKTVFEQVLEQQPGHADSLHLLGIVCHQSGESERGVELVRRAIESKPGEANFHNNLGNMLESRGELQAALDAYHAARELNTGDPYICFNLGNVLHKQGRLEESLSSYRAALGLEPNDAEFHYNIGNVLKQQGKLEEAARSYEHALQLAPSPETYNNLGNTLHELGRHAGAIRCFEKSLELVPDDAHTLNNLGNTLRKQGRCNEAVAAFRRAIGAAPALAPAHCNLGDALREQGDLTAARAACEEAIRLAPDSAAAHNNLGQVFANAGDFVAAMRHFRRAIALDPGVSDAWLNLSRAHRFRRDDRDDIQLMESRLAGGGLSTASRVHLHFALGKAYSDCDDIDSSFTHFQSGNGLESQHRAFDPQAHDAWIDKSIATFNRDFFQRTAGYGDPSTLPIFVVGMPRSGTTLVEHILSCHPRVHGAGELTRIGELAAGLGSPGVGQLEAATVQEMAGEYLGELRSLAREHPHVTDKMPANFLHLGVIVALFPNATVIHCRRDAMATCFSCYTQLFAGGNDYTYDLRHLGAFYRAYVRLMRHWAAVLPRPVYDLRYEELVNDRETVVRSLIEHCGLGWDDACLAHHANTRSVRTASHWQVRQPVYKHAMHHWKRYEKHLEPLAKALGDEIVC